MGKSGKFIAVMMGSDTDLPVMQATVEVLREFEVNYELRVLSAHRTPDETRAYVRDAESRGCAVFVAGAGMAAHLAGSVAAGTIRPVIGVPIDAGPLSGFDALLSTVQMPGGVPVATVAIGKAGARNAGYLAAQILALSDDDLAERVAKERRKQAEAVIARDAGVREG